MRGMWSVILIVCCMSAAIYYADKNFIVPPVVENQRNTVDAIATWIETNIRYEGEADGRDYWKTPEETLRDGRGDCEDLALLLLSESFQRLGVEGRFVIARSPISKNEYHAFARFGKRDYFADGYVYAVELLNVPFRRALELRERSADTRVAVATGEGNNRSPEHRSSSKGN